MMDYLMLREAENYQYCDENYKDQQRNVNIVLRRQTMIFNKGLTYLIWKYFREHWANDNENSEEKQSININVNCEIISLSPQSLTKEEEHPQYLHPVRSKWAKSLLLWNWIYCWVFGYWPMVNINVKLVSGTCACAQPVQHRGFNLSSPDQAQKPMAQVLKVSLSVINIECLMKNRQKKSNSMANRWWRGWACFWIIIWWGLRSCWWSACG